MYTNQLLLAKRLFSEARLMFEREDDVSCGLAVSLLQDSAEMFVWTLSKKENVTLKPEAGFVAQLQALKDKPLTLAGATGLTDLNKARVNFKHYGNLPSITERPKFEAAAETFLRAGMRDHFAVDFDTLTMVDLVPYADANGFLKEAEAAAAACLFDAAMVAAAKAHLVLLDRLDILAPESPRHDLDRLDGVLGFQVTTTMALPNLARFLDELRDANTLAMLRIPVRDVLLLRRSLPSAHRMGSDVTTYWGYGRNAPTDLNGATAVIEAVVNVAMRMQALTGITV